jgi:RNA polymerase sigma-70 factor (ECF subfamily)
VIEALTSRAAASNQIDFEALIGPLVEPGLRLAYSMLGNREEAEDATQEAVTRAWRSLSSLRDRALARPWFLAIVANHCRNVRRTRWFKTIRLPSFLMESRTRSEVERVDLARGLARLPANDRQALFMHFYLDLPIDETALALGVSVAAAKRRIYRACRRLRSDVREEDV